MGTVSVAVGNVGREKKRERGREREREREREKEREEREKCTWFIDRLDSEVCAHCPEREREREEGGLEKGMRK